MTRSLTLYKAPVGQQPHEMNVPLFIQRIVISVLVVFFVFLFNGILKQTFTAGPALVQLKSELFEREVARMRTELAAIIKELFELRTVGVEALKKELITFSVEVWKSDIEELQEDMSDVIDKTTSNNTDIISLKEQVDILSQELVAFKKSSMEEIASLQAQLKKKMKRTPSTEGFLI